MHTIHKQLDIDGGENLLTLDPNQRPNPNVWMPPVMWEGFLNNEKIRIAQNAQYSSGADDFEFELFQEKFDALKPDIVRAIQEATKAMEITTYKLLVKLVKSSFYLRID